MASVCLAHEVAEQILIYPIKFCPTLILFRPRVYRKNPHFNRENPHLFGRFSRFICFLDQTGPLQCHFIIYYLVPFIQGLLRIVNGANTVFFNQ